jgi:hypothetical protein
MWYVVGDIRFGSQLGLVRSVTVVCIALHSFVFYVGYGTLCLILLTLLHRLVLCTLKQIPETDAECRWDWRSVRCEPACECALQPKRGDYHLGRSCRRRPFFDSDDENTGSNGMDMTCVDVDAATLWLERPATRRIVSLIVQTGQILRDRSRAVIHQVRSGSIQRFHRMQTNVCTDLWTMTHGQANGGCLSIDDLPMTSIQERMLCGSVEFVVCDDDDVEVSNNHVNRGSRRRSANEPMARRAWADL